MKIFLIASGGVTMAIIAISVLGNYLSERPRPEPMPSRIVQVQRHFDPLQINNLADLLMGLCRPSLADEHGHIRMPLNWSYYQTRRYYTPFELIKLQRAINMRLGSPMVRWIHQDRNYFIIHLET